MSANQATYISIIIGLGSCIFLALGSYTLKLAGAFLAALYLLLDCVDGNIARYRKSASLFGKFIDASASYIISSFLFMSIGAGIFTDPDSSVLLRHPESFLIPFNKHIFLIVGFWSALSYVLARLISLRYKTMIASNLDNDSAGNLRPNRYFQIISIMSRNIFGVSGFFMPLLLLAAVFRLFDLLALFYAFVNSIALVFIVVKTTMNMKSAVG
jgi:phosphatidylglycerophosphate synthase